MSYPPPPPAGYPLTFPPPPQPHQPPYPPPHSQPPHQPQSTPYPPPHSQPPHQPQSTPYPPPQQQSQHIHVGLAYTPPPLQPQHNIPPYKPQSQPPNQEHIHVSYTHHQPQHNIPPYKPQSQNQDHIHVSFSQHDIPMAYTPPPADHFNQSAYHTPPPQSSSPQQVIKAGCAIIGPQYVVAHPMDVSIVRKVMNITDGNFVVEDSNGNFLFKVKGTLLSIHDRRILLDATGNPLVTIRQKIKSVHDRWQVFRGDSSDPRDLIFTAKRTSMIQLKTKLDVFLANNTREDVCDFKVKGSWLERSCVVYAGESNTIVAQMHKKHSVQSLLIGKDKFNVTVYPNIDYAFIVSLIVVLDAINKD